MARWLWAIEVVTVLQFYGFGGVQGLVRRQAASGKTQILQERQCYEALPKAQKQDDGCQCLIHPEPHRATWDLTKEAMGPPPGVELRPAGAKGIGLFATKHFKQGADVGWATAHVMPCKDFTAHTTVGERFVGCESHLFELSCDGSNEALGVFPEWQDFLNHADEANSTAYFGPAQFEVGSDGAVIKQRWQLKARRDLKPGEEITYDYCYGSYELQEVQNQSNKIAGANVLAAARSSVAFSAFSKAKRPQCFNMTDVAQAYSSDGSQDPYNMTRISLEQTAASSGDAMMPPPPGPPMVPIWMYKMGLNFGKMGRLLPMMMMMVCGDGHCTVHRWGDPRYGWNLVR